MSNARWAKSLTDAVVANGFEAGKQAAVNLIERWQSDYQMLLDRQDFLRRTTQMTQVERIERERLVAQVNTCKNLARMIREEVKP